MRVAVIGGGASGLFCAANLHGCDTTVFEKNSTCGKKLLLTGGGRCNYTNASEDFFDGVPKGAKFLRSAISAFDASALVGWFRERGLDTAFEGKRAFPETRKAESVLNLLISECIKNGVKFEYGSAAGKIEKTEDGKFVVCKREFDVVVVATGGKTFPKTGSCGDGNLLLEKLGIDCAEFEPRLGPIFADGTKPLQGISMTVGISFSDGQKSTKPVVGDAVFTHFGISGPAALDFTAFVGAATKVVIDFLPSEGKENIVELLKQKRKEGSGSALALFSNFVPKNVAKFILSEAKLIEKPLADFSNQDIQRLATCIKSHEFDFVRRGNFNESWVSAGGVKLDELVPKTMECKKVKNLFVIGEAIDCFGLCGGYNLQIAFSTAFAAATCIKNR